jgi:hypothetical protein
MTFSLFWTSVRDRQLRCEFDEIWKYRPTFSTRLTRGPCVSFKARSSETSGRFRVIVYPLFTHFPEKVYEPCQILRRTYITSVSLRVNGRSSSRLSQYNSRLARTITTNSLKILAGFEWRGRVGGCSGIIRMEEKLTMLWDSDWWQNMCGKFYLGDTPQCCTLFSCGVSAIIFLFYRVRYFFCIVYPRGKV